MTRLAILAVTFALLTGGCSDGKNAAPTTATGATASSIPGPQQLTDLRDLGRLRSLFNTRSGEPRLIVLVSPT